MDEVEQTSPANRHTRMWDTLQQRSHSPDSHGNVPVQHGNNNSATPVKLEEPLSNSANRISLPSFRESFPFAVSEATYDYVRPGYLSRSPPPFRPQLPQESMLRPVFNFKADLKSLSNYGSPILSNQPLFHSYRLGCVRATSETSSSVSSINGDWTDYTRPTSRATSVCSRGETSPSDVKASFFSADTSRHFSEPNNPDTKIPSIERLSISNAIATQEDFLPVVKRARTTSCSSDDSSICDGQRYAGVDPLLTTRSPRQTPPSLSPAAWPSALPVPRSTTRPRRSRAHNQTRQDWQNYAAREADGSWRCIWTEGELTCTYKSKKQATKRHIELKHMKMKPHSCCYCERTFGQRTTLDVHMATHTGQKDHICPDFGCTERYSDASRLLRHRVAAHGYIVRHTAPKQLNCLGRKSTTRKKARSRVAKLLV